MVARLLPGIGIFLGILISAVKFRMANAEVISWTILVMVVMDRPKTMGMMPTTYMKVRM